ncbi:hypothetical protein NEIPOLOT_02184 [Neisseria polysaccharea ATCC 43768]|nr:hypothetical protein NEIPOLOT_02184 [Neisseria polysaccharea ATCC 43768]
MFAVYFCLVQTAALIYAVSVCRILLSVPQMLYWEKFTDCVLRHICR